jgi:LPXTG-site transpeptidase (sortase) family protein
MFAFLHKSWPVLIGVLLFLFSTQDAAAILRESPDTYPSQAVEPTQELGSSPAISQMAWQEIPGYPQKTGLADEPSVSLNLSGVISPGGSDSPVTTAEPSDKQDIPVTVPIGPAIPPSPPNRLVIPAIDLDTPVVPAASKTITVAGKEYQQWKAPDRFAAGWHTGSAEPGLPGNTVLNGHNNIKGEVFKRLEELSVGDQILVYSFEGIFIYEIANLMILPEKYEQLDTRMNNAQWILPSQDERLTLVTCWPYEGNTHRLIIVARPVLRERIIRNVQ